MIDLHIHLLPGIDDGAASPEVTKLMLERARDLGFRTLVATPHLPGPLNDRYQARVDRAFDLTRELAAPLGVEVRLGFEAALTPNLPHRLERGEPATLGGSKAVLVDLPFGAWPQHASETFFALQTAGYTPVLAHPERYADVQRDPERAVDLAARGVLLQVTIGSLAGVFGKAPRRTAEALLRRGTVHLAATDAHSAKHRFMAVPDGLERLAEIVGEAGVERLTVPGPRALLDGGVVPPVPLASPGRVGPLGIVTRLIRRPSASDVPLPIRPRRGQSGERGQN